MDFLEQKMFLDILEEKFQATSTFQNFHKPSYFIHISFVAKN